MQHISQIRATPLTSPPTASLDGVRPIPLRRIEDIFERLNAQLGKKFTDLWTSANPEHIKTEWADGLAGFRGREILRGLKACQIRVFAPTLGEFIRLCRPALDPEIAWLEARAGLQARRDGLLGEWSHPAVFRVSQIFPYELTNQSFKECRKSWEYRLQREFDKGWLDDVPPPPLQLEIKPATTRPPTAAERAVLFGLPGANQAKE